MTTAATPYASSGEPGSGSGERTEHELRDRQMIELLNELRVALPGVQILFAFLLTVPFAVGFEKVTDFQRDVYFVALLGAAGATACLIAPTAFHRILFKEGQKKQLIHFGSSITVAGLGFLALAVTASVLLVTDYIYGGKQAVVAAAAAGILMAGLWFALPVSRRLRRH